MQGGFDVLFRLHDMPTMPPALLLDRSLKAAGLLPMQLLRTSQADILAHVAPLAVAAAARHVQGALDALAPFAGLSADAAFSLADSAAPSAASALARALSALALSSEVVRVVPGVLEQLNAGGLRGQSIMSNVSGLEVACRALLPVASRWLDAAALRKRLGAAAEALSGVRPPAGALDAAEAARVAAVLGRASAKENKLAHRLAVAVPHLQLLSLLHTHVDHWVRSFHLAVCKCVHHPTSRHRRGASAPSGGTVDPATGCILNRHSRLCLAYLVQGRKQSLDQSLLPAPGAGGAAGLQGLGAHDALAAMQQLTAMAEDVRMCLFEMRRKEYYSLALGYFSGVGGLASLEARFGDAVRLAMFVQAQADLEADKPPALASQEADTDAAGAPAAGADALMLEAEDAAREADGAAAPSPAGACGLLVLREDGVAELDSCLSDMGVPRQGSMYYCMQARMWCFAFDAGSGPVAEAAKGADDKGGKGAGAGAGQGRLPRHTPWAAAAQAVAPMLSTYLTLLSLLLHRRALVLHPAAPLLGHPLPDADGSEPPSAAIRPTEAALRSIQAAAAKAVLMLWSAVTSSPASSPRLPTAVLSHLITTLCIAYMSQADKVKVLSSSAAPARTRNLWGPGPAVRPPFIPSENTVAALSDQMGFPREQVQFVMNRLQTNEVTVLANYFLEHDVESMMRASQASAARREAATAAVAAAVSTAERPPGSAEASGPGGGRAGASGSRAAPGGDASAPGASSPGLAATTCSAPGAPGDAPAAAEPDMLAQALKDSLHVVSSQGSQPELTEGLGLPDVAAVGEGLLQLCLPAPENVFVVCPLLQQAAEGAPQDAVDWIAAKIHSHFGNAVQVRPKPCSHSSVLAVHGATQGCTYPLTPACHHLHIGGADGTDQPCGQVSTCHPLPHHQVLERGKHWQ